MFQVVYFVNSGSEANDLAVHMARMHTGTYEIISLRCIINTWNDSWCSVKCGKAHYVKLFMCAIPALNNIQSSDWTKWHCVLWRYVNSRLFSDQMSFQILHQTGCQYNPLEGIIHGFFFIYINLGILLSCTEPWNFTSYVRKAILVHVSGILGEWMETWLNMDVDFVYQAHILTTIYLHLTSN